MILALALQAQTLCEIALKDHDKNFSLLKEGKDKKKACSRIDLNFETILRECYMTKKEFDKILYIKKTVKINCEDKF